MPNFLQPQAPLSMRFPRQEYWSGFPFPSPGDLPNPGFKPKSPALAGEFFTAELPGKPNLIHTMNILGQVVLLQGESKFWRKIQLETPFDHISKPHSLVSINFKN